MAEILKWRSRAAISSGGIGTSRTARCHRFKVRTATVPLSIWNDAGVKRDAESEPLVLAASSYDYRLFI